MKIKLFFILLALTVVMSSARSQNTGKKVTISGHVVDATNNPVEGVVILIDNKDSGKKTNSKGFYKIKVSPTADSLSAFSYFDGMTIAIDNKTTIDFSLSKVQTSNNKIESRMSPTNPNRLEGSVNKNAQYSTVYEMLTGTVPGVNVNGKSITIRGQTSLYGSAPPLFVVDGVIVSSIDYIRPVDVVTIEVVKSSSAAIYGSRGSNGVIRIKTVNSVK
jgi:hypothetical protein